MRAKNVGKKIVSKKCENTSFIFTLIRDQKMGGGWKARNNFTRKTRIVPAKKVGKKIVSKKCKNTFLYSHEYRDQKMGGKNA